MRLVYGLHSSEPSISLLPALVEGDLSVRKPRRLPRQLDDRLPLLAAISERHQKKTFISFLHNLDLGWGFRHGSKTQLSWPSSACKHDRATRWTCPQPLYLPSPEYRRRGFRTGLAAAASSIQAGAWSLALRSPRTSRATAAAFSRGAIVGLSSKWSNRSPASRGHRSRR
jgi:hypothetical protein